MKKFKIKDICAERNVGKKLAEMLRDFFVEIFSYIFKEIYNEGKSTIKRIKNTDVFKNAPAIKFQKNFAAEIEELI